MVAPGQHEMPAIHGDLVVWSDNRNRPEERPLTQTGGYNGRPSIHGQRVTWQQFREHNESTIVLLDLDDSQQTIIGDGGRGRSRQLISEDYLVWAVAEPCDVLGISLRKDQSDVYAYRLQTREVRQLSDYVEPMVVLHGKVALIAEVCFGVRRQFAVHIG